MAQMTFPGGVSCAARFYTGAVFLSAARLLACAVMLGLGACTPRLDVPPAPAGSARLTYIGRVAWGEVAAYEAEYAAREHASFAGLDWSRNGCSAPAGLGLGYRDLFRPACNVHDFAYRNLGREARTDVNRLRSDAALSRNLQTICRSLARAQRPGCLAAASAYVRAVRWRGDGHF